MGIKIIPGIKKSILLAAGVLKGLKKNNKDLNSLFSSFLSIHLVNYCTICSLKSAFTVCAGISVGRAKSALERE